MMGCNKTTLNATNTHVSRRLMSLYRVAIVSEIPLMCSAVPIPWPRVRFQLYFGQGMRNG